MKFLGKSCAVLLISLVSVCCLSPVLPVFAKAKVYRETISMETGGRQTIKAGKVRTGVKWTVSDKKIVSIRETKGKNKTCAVLKAGKKTGSCTVKAASGKKVFYFKVYVKKAGEAVTYRGKKTKAALYKVRKTEDEILVQVKLYNGSDKDLWYGAPFSLERREKGRWKKVKMETQVVFPAVVYKLPAHTVVSRSYGLSPYFGESGLKVGTYRIRVNAGYRKKKDRYVKFEL